ncbi:iron complex transport system substrate-binding protein [Lipingzhangella halophila]|uniref:Iron complex transport system substrate-binding protein n=1 Tax=Lipingzhangella halophila TaxID=1783352 RepID=A0A7W7REH9_9ACTN|nr:ABC transporter substrate-binding protein [Lipingzhangella halophila]MBB4930429.1 iron complex transport system substrate-binding protein [Lipingzhangella halophila]
MSRARSYALSRRGLFTACGTLGLAGLVSACGDSSDEGGANAGSWTFEDDRGETVKTDGAPSNIVAFVGTAAALYDYGIECVGVFGPTTTEGGEPDVQAGEIDVDSVEVLGNAWGEFSVEDYAALEPDVLISAMFEEDTLWYVPEESAEEILAIAPSIGLNVANVSLPEPLERHAELAEALGADLDSEQATKAKERFDAAAETLQEAAESSDIKVLACSGDPDLFYASNPEMSADLRYFQELGVDFVVPEKLDDGGFFESLSWENADKYDADILFVDNRSSALQPEDMASKPTWDELPAVGADQVVPWVSEPRYSYAGCAPLLEDLAEAINKAKKVR